MATVFYSTGGYRGHPSTAVEKLVTLGISQIELSGGLHEPRWRERIAEFIQAPNIQLHNYFPPPLKPFVFNLASATPAIRTSSINHARKAIQISAELGCTRFSFHAGFLVDPIPNLLGKPWPSMIKAPYDKGFELFLTAVHDLASWSSDFGIELLVENNVLTQETCSANGDDVLLMATGQQISSALNEFPPEVGLLLDVGHLSVTAKTVGGSKGHWALDVMKWVRGLHLSENDERSDSGHPLSQDSWFKNLVSEEIPSITLEIDESHGVDPLQQVEIVKGWLHGR